MPRFPDDRSADVIRDPVPTPADARAVFSTGNHKAYRPLAWDELHARYGLTRREAQVARQLATGSTNSEVASALRISVHTVRRHVEHVLGRLRVRRRTEVAAKLLVTQAPPATSSAD
jgi:DNA-binding NarL/FixJ family response regulator